MINDHLYFGTTTADGVVSEDQWAIFLSDIVTPEFPDGLTVFQGAGQWRTGSGAILLEDSHVLNIVHSDNEKSESALREIMSEYKSRFNQQSVLRVKTPSCVTF